MRANAKLIAQFVIEHGIADQEKVKDCLSRIEEGETSDDLPTLLHTLGHISDDDRKIIDRVFPEGSAPSAPAERQARTLSEDEVFLKVVQANGVLPAEFVREARETYHRRVAAGETLAMADLLFELGFMTAFQIDEIKKRMKKRLYRCEGCDKPYNDPEGSVKCPACGLTLPRPGKIITLEFGSAVQRAGHLRIIVGTNQGLVYEIGADSRVTLGRNKKNKVRVYGKNVSREHAVIETHGASALVRDLKSRFGILLNGQRVLESALADGDLIKVGQTVLEYRAQPEPTPAPQPGTGRLFGEIAVSMGFTTAAAVEHGLSEQKSTREGMRIGQILSINGQLTEVQIAQVLQMQRTPASPPPLPAAGEDRGDLFGNIAVGQGYIRPGELTDALADQARQRTKERRRIGEILVSKKALHDDLVKDVLRRQHGEDALPNIKGYEILEKIGSGGMGRVYRAQQVSLDREVAIKVLSPSLASDKTFVRRFVSEARSAGRLNHANIIRAIDVGESGGHFYFAMEYVSGGTVYDRLRRQGQLSEEETIDIGIQMLKALTHAKKHSLVHRDIKPDNIMINERGVAKLCDLGLAKNTNVQANETRADEAVGTPNYVSPEQAKGVKDIDIRADIYSLGATLYHMVTGHIPFKRKGSPIVVMAKHITDQIPNPRKLNGALNRDFCRVLEMMMVKDRKKRYQSPDEIIKDLEKVRRGEAPKLPRIISAKSTVSKDA